MPDIFVQPIEKNPAIPPSSKIPHIHHLASFCDHPGGITFRSQESDEIILLFLRRHFITNVPWIIVSLVLIVIPPFLSMFLSDISSFFLSLPSAFLSVFIIFYYLVILTFVIVEFITWYFNTSIVTQKRIIDIDFSDLLYHDVAITKLNLVEDTNYTQTGFIRSLFNYGDVFVQTAAEKVHFDFLAVPNPTKAINIIQNLIGKGKHA